MKTFREFILESSCNGSPKGMDCPVHGSSKCPKIKSHKTVEAIAAKHRLDVSFIENQLNMGISIEHEHTKNKKIATNIALQHLDEIPDYYTRLKKMEKSAKNEYKKFKNVKETVTIEDANGNTFLEIVDLIKPEKMKGVSEETASGDDSLHDWFAKSKSKDGKPGWVQLGGPYAGKPCARQPGQTSTPKCGSSKMKRDLSKKEEETAFRRKNKQDPNQPQKTGAAKPTNVKTEETIIEKKDACYHKVKSRYRVWPSAYACVPENSSKALTRNGWKSVEELNIGEEILTFNLYKDELEFKPILNLHRYKNAQTKVIKSGNTGFVFECTENHKWVVKIPYQKTNRSSEYQKINGKFFIETKDLLENKYNKLLLVSSFLNEGIPTKKDSIYKYGDNWIKYILDISPEQRQTWLFSSIVYDGNQKKVEKIKNNDYLIGNLSWNYNSPHNKQSFGFKQKDIMHRDAFLLSGFLNGGSVVWKKNKQKNIYSCHYISNKNYKNTSNFKVVKENITDVWCPQTENQTWVMLQETEGNGIITITGNSGALVKCRKVGAKSWGTKSESTNALEYDWDTPIYEGEKRYCPKCKKMEHINVCKYGPKFWKTYSLAVEPHQQTKDILQHIFSPNIGENYNNKSKKELKIIQEVYTRIQSRGSTYNIILNWRGKYLSVQMFFPQFTRPSKNQVTYEIRKIYPQAIVLTFNPATKDPTKPLLFTGDENESKRH